MTRTAASPAAPTAPRFANAWAALVYAAAALALGWPALLGKFLVNPMSDQYKGGYAFREFAAHTLRTTGHFPLWNPYLFGGMPYVAAMHGDIFYPTFLLRMVLPTDVAMTWSFIIHVFLAGFFTYLFLRAWGLSFAASLAGGLAYLMSGPIAAQVSPGHDGKLYVSALLPLVLFLIVRGVRDGRLWSYGVMAIVIGLAVLSPHPQLLQYLLLASGAFALWIATGIERPAAITRLGLAAAAVAVGFLIGAVQYLPVLQYVAWSPRAGGLSSYERATSFSFPPEEFLNIYLPQFSGILENYWGRNGIHFHSEYLGAVVLVLAGLGLAAAAKKERHRAFAWFWIGTLIVATLWSLGGFTPFYRLIYLLVPGTKFFRAPSTMMFLMALAVAVLAALGIERVESGKVTRRYAIGWLIGAGLVALLGVTGALNTMAQSLAGPGRADAAADNASQVLFGSLRSFVAVALAAGVLLAVTQRRLAPSVAALSLAGLAAIDLWSVEQTYWRFSPPASLLYAGNSITDYLQKQDQPGRVLALGLSPERSGRDPELELDGLMSHSIRDVLGYHGNELGRYDILLDQEHNYRQIGNPQAWRLLNIRWLLTDVTPSPIPDSKPVLGPVTDAAGSSTYLYELGGHNPFAWVAPAIVKGPDDAVLTTVLDPRFDPLRAALFDTAAPVTGKQLTKLPDSTGITARTTHYAPGSIEIELDKPAPEGSALVVSENYYPGWTATVDGKSAPIGRADYVLIGVALPAGAREITLRFDSPPFERGKSITILALLVGIAAAGGGWALDRKGRKADA